MKTKNFTPHFPNLMEMVDAELIGSILKRFINPSRFIGLTENERHLYDVALEGEIIKALIPSRKTTDEDLNMINAVLPRNNWGLMVFKPPRAGTDYRASLESELRDYLQQYNLTFLGKYELKSLTRDLLIAMYPGQQEMNYWQNTEKQLLGLPACYYLFESEDNQFGDIRPYIESIKGWYKIDESKKRYSTRKGLRSIFRELVTSKEGKFHETLKGSRLYEDGGIHAPCSPTGRYIQLIGLMGCDIKAKNWVRSCLPWLNGAMSDAND